MRRFLVRSIGGGITIDFHKDKPRGVIGLLDDIKAGNAGFLQAGAGIGERGDFECLDAFRFHSDMNVNNEHDREIGQFRNKLKPDDDFAGWRGESAFV